MVTYGRPDDSIRSTAQRRDDKGDVRNGAEWLAIWSDPASLKSIAEKNAERHAHQQVQDAADSIAAAIRALSGKPDLDIRFGQGTDSDRQIFLPDLADDLSNLDALRGMGDAKASLLRHHNPDLHQTRFDSDRDRLLMILEGCRCTGIAAQYAPGITANLAAAQTDRLRRATLLDAHLASLIPLSEALRMVARDIFHGVPEPSIQTAGFRMWDAWLRARYQPELDAMARCLPDQAAFAVAAGFFLDRLMQEVSGTAQRPHRLTPTAPKDAGPIQTDQLRETDQAKDAVLFEPGDTLFLEDETEAAPERPVSPPLPYRVFTTAHDQIVQARDLPGLGDLRATRRKLDEKQAALRQEMSRLFARLQRRLMAERLSRWDFDLDEGMIDAARLDRVIVNPGFSNAYKQEIRAPFRDTCVTLLIDNSGSMRGKQVETACTVADMLLAVLEKCGVATELLGFTTGGWKGGQSAKDWMRAGKPDNPGRLNDLLHIIYKDAETPLRRARDAICAMLHPSVLKENIDGEALLWAEKRLMARQEARKILIVISDGAPMDQATVERNSDEDLIHRHLQQVITRLEATSPIELSAIGIKHDVSPYYTTATQIASVTELGPALIDLLDRHLT